MGENLLKRIREVTDKEIKYLILTHYHGDHIQGAQVFKEAVIISHSNTKKNIEKIKIPRIEEAKTKSLPAQIKSAKEKVEKFRAENNPELKKAGEELSFLERRLFLFILGEVILMETSWFTSLQKKQFTWETLYSTI